MKKRLDCLRIYAKSLHEIYLAAPGYAVLLFILIPLQSVLPVLLVVLSQALLTELTRQATTTATLVSWAIVLLLLCLFTPLVTMIQGLMTDKLVASINLRLMAHSSQLLGLAVFENSAYYDELEFIRSEAAWRPVNLIVFGLSVIRDTVTIVSYILLLSQFSWWIVVLIVVPAIPQALVAYRIQRSSFESMVDQSTDARKLQYYTEVLLTEKDAKEMRIFNAFPFFTNKYKRTYEKLHNQTRRIRTHQMSRSVVFVILDAVAVTISLVAVIHGIQTNQYQLSSLLAFTAAVTALAQTLSELVEGSSMLLDTLLYMQKYFHFLTLREPTEFHGTKQLPQGPLAVEFANVSFHYPQSDAEVLHQVSFKIAPGEKVAIVGENGSGKSTLVKLLANFYQVDQGAILVDGQPLTEVDVQQYRAHIRVAFQDFSKFLLPLRESVGIADTNNDADANIVTALTKAGLGDWLTKQAVGLDTQLGKRFPGGIELSGGQWQKIAVARAFLTNEKADLVILDEPTAAIDPNAEHDLYDQFSKLSANKTVLFITHRLSSVTMADRVLFIADGRVAGFATHAELMHDNPQYRHMYMTQAESYVKGSNPD
ncbi:ABC transporter ATP-binding protein [Lacticaseibacillus nasuensis]|uniref:ABC transporter ATP-binding protein n=1 Tax=Lacticaseibacillus nasuensis TaxID=944671 RepID=UPI0022457ED9|nr:ABC transporter ATP-binding protein [Lacticaseibacillus nasuensis]MCX2454648.1 ABC transporter ATP-binding protein/permease [Lacticaseibacillus nasuensis]